MVAEIGTWRDQVMQVFLETQRLLLRRFTMADADALAIISLRV
jgi:hypothetical protein